MITRLNRLAEKGKSRGGWSFRCWNAMTELLWVKMSVVLEYDLGARAPLSDAPGGTVAWFVPKREDLKNYADRSQFGLAPGELGLIDEILADGGWFLIARIDGRDAARAACTVKRRRFIHSRYRVLGDREGFITHCFTEAEHRGKGLGPLCIGEICRRCREQGFETLFIDIETMNTPSIRSAEKAGARPARTTYYVVRLFRQDRFLWVRGRDKRYMQNGRGL
jgi:GNAT superfamily N-acetyltransferase